MKYFLALLLLFLILFLIIFFTTLQIHIEVKRKKMDDRITIRFKIWAGLIRYRKESSLLKLSEDLSGLIYQSHMGIAMDSQNRGVHKFTLKEAMYVGEKANQFRQQVQMLNVIIKKFSQKIYVDKLVWLTGIGSGDAAETGVLTGLIWGIKASLVSLGNTYVSLSTSPQIFVQPFFNEKRFETEFESIFHFRIGYAMLAGIRIFLNFKKGGIARGRTPYSRFNEDSDGKFKRNG